jgi:hypothetical protein
VKPNNAARQQSDRMRMDLIEAKAILLEIFNLDPATCEKYPKSKKNQTQGNLETP